MSQGLKQIFPGNSSNYPPSDKRICPSYKRTYCNILYQFKAKASWGKKYENVLPAAGDNPYLLYHNQHMLLQSTHLWHVPVGVRLGRVWVIRQFKLNFGSPVRMPPLSTIHCLRRSVLGRETEPISVRPPLQLLNNWTWGNEWPQRWIKSVVWVRAECNTIHMFSLGGGKQSSLKFL